MYRDDVISSEMSRQNLTDTALAEITGLTRQKIGELRTGTAKDPKLSTLTAVATGLGIDLQKLVEPRAA